MEGSEGSNLCISTLERLARNDYISHIKEDYGPCGIAGAVFIAIFVPIFLTLALMGKKKVKQRGVPVEAGAEAGLAMRNAKSATLIEVPWEGLRLWLLYLSSPVKYILVSAVLELENLLVGNLSLQVMVGSLRNFTYQWESYGQVFDRACNFASGLVNLGHDVDTRAAIFSESRAEWLIAFQGCFRQNITVVTIYASLGDDALVHSLNEAQASTLICDAKQLKKLAAIGSSLKIIKNIILKTTDGN